MTNITEHFSRGEFACKCGCGFDVVDIELVQILEHLRKRYGEAVILNSCWRCLKHNTAIGGSEHSQHLLGKAADIVIVNTPPHLIQEYLISRWKGGLGLYDSFTHIDVGNKRRWVG